MVLHCSDIDLHVFLFLPQVVICMSLLTFTMCTHVRLSRACVLFKKNHTFEDWTNYLLIINYLCTAASPWVGATRWGKSRCHPWNHRLSFFFLSWNFRAAISSIKKIPSDLFCSALLRVAPGAVLGLIPLWIVLTITNSSCYCDLLFKFAVINIQMRCVVLFNKQSIFLLISPCRRTWSTRRGSGRSSAARPSSTSFT